MKSVVSWIPSAYRPIALWWVAFYGVWLGLVIHGRHWETIFSHWGIAVAMAVGSYFAGSTPMGGGTVGFPVLTLLFNEPATLGRDFSFAVQSIGMTSASILILCRRQTLEWPMLRWSLLGSLVGTPVGVLFIAPVVSDLAIKMVFGVVWASFGLLHFWELKKICANKGMTAMPAWFDRASGVSIGLVGGATVAAVTGVGVDMLLYAVLVLVVRADLKVAIPTSVILMAFTSIVGIATRGLFGDVPSEVYANWLAAAPVVALGAPLGAFVVHLVGRRPTLIVVSVLCIVQFVWTLYNERLSLGAGGLLLACVAVVVCNVVFAVLYRAGNRFLKSNVVRSQEAQKGKTPRSKQMV